MLKEEDSVRSVVDGFGHIAYIDQTAPPAGSVIPNFEALCKRYSDLQKLQEGDLPIYIKMAILYEVDKPSFEQVVSQFRGVFPIVEEVRFVRMSMAPFADIPDLRIKEIGVDRWIPEGQMSSGMFRTLMHLGSVILWPDEQGAKEVLLADEAYRLDPAQSFLVSVDLPVAARVRLVAPDVVLPLLGCSVALRADLELVQVVVLPAHDRLDDVVQTAQRAVLRLGPSPDRRPDIVQRDFQLVNRAPGRLRRRRGAPWFRSLPGHGPGHGSLAAFWLHARHEFRSFLLLLHAFYQAVLPGTRPTSREPRRNRKEPPAPRMKSSFQAGSDPFRAH